MSHKKLLVFDFFSGTGSSTQAFKDAGHNVVTFEMDKQFSATETVNVMDIESSRLLNEYGQPDFIWASPPCTAFSVASIGHHWARGGTNPIPKTKEAEYNQLLVAHTLNLISELKPTYGWLMENPVGMLRKLPVVLGLIRNTVTYCQYGEERQKPTDLWGFVINWIPRAMCKRGAPCHIAAPRGSQTGTQGIKGSKDRSRIPYQLSQELLQSITKSEVSATFTTTQYFQPAIDLEECELSEIKL